MKLQTIKVKDLRLNDSFLDSEFIKNTLDSLDNRLNSISIDEQLGLA